MRNYLIGLITGIAIAGSTIAYAANGFGTGYMFGWTVILDGDTVCHEPYMWSATHEIECD